MAFVTASSTTAASTSTINVTIDTGTSANRKAICLWAWQHGLSLNSGSCVRDPDGANESCIKELHSGILNQFDAFYSLQSFYLDLSVTGSQTFRFSHATAMNRIVAGVIVWDELNSGPAEVIESYITTSSSDSFISDDITTITNNSLIVQNGFMFDGTVTTPFFTPSNGQTEQWDRLGANWLVATAGTLVKTTAGLQTIGSTGLVTCSRQGQQLLAYAPVPPRNRGNFTQGKPFSITNSPATGKRIVITN